MKGGNLNQIVVHNPVLPGFHPDPSLCKAGEDYYIATSSFEYFPGVVIYKSRNLQNWTICSYALTRKEQLNMEGNPPSGGIWAPCLSFDKGTFYLIFTDTKSWSGAFNTGGFKDTHNYLTTASSIEGPWSNPIYLNSSGFDPSLFHDDDGKKWLVNMIWDYRNWEHNFAGIVLQEFDEEKQSLIGPRKNIFNGTDLKITEAPHIYKRNGFYYLMTAEGGTSYFHAVTLARSIKLDGPYELHPHKYLLTSVANRAALEDELAGGGFNIKSLALHKGLQKAGHGSMAPWTGNEWILAHLCSRPIEENGRCPLGRETALQKIIWKDDNWPYLIGTGASETVSFSGKKNIESSEKSGNTVFWIDNFDKDSWDIKLNTLRIPAGDNFSLKDRPGWLRLYGAESPVSRFNQT
ncbi:MAG: family 43 glycosylhydrolase, partial [Spirochaetaceae bacterium]|nr:family 43 glycosylhydrolase [Spirochaetaceae bacterium]